MGVWGDWIMEVEAEVRGSALPASRHVSKGRPLRITIDRWQCESSSTCHEQMVSFKPAGPKSARSLKRRESQGYLKVLRDMTSTCAPFKPIGVKY